MSYTPGGRAVRTEEEIKADAKRETPFSNHTSYEVWQRGTCYYGNGCVHDSMSDPAYRQDQPEVFCPLITASLMERTPKEWLDEVGELSGKCTEYSEAPDTVDDHESHPEPEDDTPLPGQGSLFDFNPGLTFPL